MSTKQSSATTTGIATVPILSSESRIKEVFPGQSEEERRMEVKRRIEEGLRVRLTSQGVTGVVYLEADNLDPNEYRPVTIAWTPKTLYIPSGRSTVTVLGSALTKIAKDLEQAEVHKVTADLDALLLSLTKLTDDTDMKPAKCPGRTGLS